MAVGIGNFIDRLQLGSREDAQVVIGSSAYGICTTAANEQNKIVNLPGFVLQNHNGVTVHIRFQYNNTAENPTLNISNTGNIPIVQYSGVAVGTDDETTGWHAGAVLSLTYDETLNAWIRNTGYNTNTTYNNLSAAINGTNVSLVTTGEKYIWNNKSDIASLTLGAGIYGTQLTTSGEIKLNLKSYDAITYSPETNSNVVPVVLDSNSQLAVQIPPSAGVNSLFAVGFDNSTENQTNTTNNVYVRLFNNSVFNTQFKLIGGTNVTVISDNAGGITISANDPTVTQTESNTNSNYELLFSGSASNTTLTETTNKSNKLLFNPSTGILTISNSTDAATLSPTSYSGNATNVTGVVTLEHGGTGKTSVAGIKELLNYTPADLGLANATRFIGIVDSNSEYTPSDGHNEIPTINGLGEYTPAIGDIVIDKNNLNEYIYTSAGQWEILGHDTTVATALDTDAGDAYTPVYFINGRPVATTMLLQVPFTIGEGKLGIALNHAAFTSNSYVTNIVINSGESNLSAPLQWDSDTTGTIKLFSNFVTTGVVSGYILVIRGNSITPTSTSNIELSDNSNT